MKGQVVWIEKKFFSDGDMFDLGMLGWKIQDHAPAYWEKDLFDKVVLIPLED